MINTYSAFELIKMGEKVRLKKWPKESYVRLSRDGKDRLLDETDLEYKFSRSVKSLFDDKDWEQYFEPDTNDFATALKDFKKGHKVYRAAWQYNSIRGVMLTESTVISTEDILATDWITLEKDE